MWCCRERVGPWFDSAALGERLERKKQRRRRDAESETDQPVVDLGLRPPTQKTHLLQAGGNVRRRSLRTDEIYTFIPRGGRPLEPTFLNELFFSRFSAYEMKRKRYSYG